MRSTCFVDHFEFEFPGSVFKNAIGLGDVDNDGESELVVGNMNGDLVIYKHDRCWQKMSKLGMITAIGVGDVMNCGINALVIVCGDGWCHICLCLHPKTEDSDEIPLNVKVEPVHVQRIPPNTKVLLLEDVDGDGNIELVLGLTDRVVRMYRWMQSATGGRLVCLFKWECANQIGGLALSHNREGVPKVLVTQPGGTTMRINPEISSGAVKDGEQSERSDSHLCSSVEYDHLVGHKLRNPNISIEIISNIVDGNSSAKDKSKPYVMATLDGTVLFIKEGEIIWSQHLDHELFALSKVDLTGNGREEIIVCSWDGQTYIFDQDKNIVCFELDESVQAFCAGLYTVKQGAKATPCLVYGTFNNKILIYTNVKIPRMVPCSLFSMLNESEEMVSLIGKEVLGNRSELKKIVQRCLYGQKSKLTKPCITSQN